MEERTHVRLINTRALLISLAVSIPLSIAYYLAVDTTDHLEKRALAALSIFAGFLGTGQVVAHTLQSERLPGRLARRARTAANRVRHRVGLALLREQAEPADKPGHKEEEFVGREDELRFLEERLSGLGTAPFAVCFFGFAGVGKSRLLQEFSHRIRTKGFSVACRYGPVARFSSLGADAGQARVTLAAYLCRLMDMPESESPDQFDKLEKILPDLRNTVILIDEFPYEDLEFTDHFAWLIDRIRTKAEGRVLIVTASRVAPNLPVTAPVIIRELKGLSRVQLRHYVSEHQQPDNEFKEEILRDFERFYDFTNGNPQIAKLVVSNQASWGAVSSRGAGDRIAEVEHLTRLLAEIWNAIADDQIHEDLRMLTVVSQVEVEWADEVAKPLVPDWLRTKTELERRALLNRLPNAKYKVHDLLAEFVYDNISDPASYHARAAEYYLGEDSEAVSVTAAWHSIRADSLDLLQRAYPRAREFLFGKGEIRTVAEMIEGSAHLLRNCQDMGFTAVATRDRAEALLLLGDTSEALNQFAQARRLLEKHDMLSGELEGELLCGMGDCCRLTGRVEQGRDHFKDAVTLFRASGCEEEAIRAEIEYGHSYFLCGEMTQSLNVYQEISGELDAKAHPKLVADLCYRMAKSHRLLGQYELAITEARKAEALYATAPRSDIGVGKARWVVAGVLRMQGEYKDALEHCKRVADVFNVTGYRAALFLKHDYAEIYRATRQFERALREYQLTMERTRANNEQNRLAHSLLGIAETRRWQKQADGVAKQAIPGIDVDLYNEALSIYKRMGVKWGVVVCLIGRALARLSYWEVAKRDLTTALDIIAHEPMPVEQQCIETIMTDRRTILFPLNWI